MPVRDYISAVAAKYLSAVDADHSRSNQHEIGSNKLLAVLGDPGGTRVRMKARFLYLGEEEEECTQAEGEVTWYDVRAENPGRPPEYRLYYQGNSVTERLSAGDFCLIARQVGDRPLLLVVCPPESSVEQRLRLLFDLPGEAASGTPLLWTTRDVAEKAEDSFVDELILLELGIETAPDRDLGQLAYSRFGIDFPTTAVFSALARDLVGSATDAAADPDGALIKWYRQEEALFRAYEDRLLRVELERGFSGTDEFVHRALSVLNRRKARAGLALENHVEQILIAHGVPYDRGACTERRSKPDFLFPGSVAYRSQDFPSDRLTMLGVKSSCKDRWRQVLSEADRIPVKHLLTLELAISGQQMDEMVAQHLQLVVPRELHRTYSPSQQSRILSLAQFIGLLRERRGVGRRLIARELGPLFGSASDD